MLDIAKSSHEIVTQIFCSKTSTGTLSRMNRLEYTKTLHCNIPKSRISSRNHKICIILKGPCWSFYKRKKGVDKSCDTVPNILYSFHLEAKSRGGDGWKHRDLVAQLSPESAAPEGIEPVLKSWNSVGVDQRFGAKKPRNTNTLGE